MFGVALPKGKRRKWNVATRGFASAAGNRGDQLTGRTEGAEPRTETIVYIAI